MEHHVVDPLDVKASNLAIFVEAHGHKWPGVILAGVSKAVARIVKDDDVIGTHTEILDIFKNGVVLKVIVSQNAHRKPHVGVMGVFDK